MAQDAIQAGVAVLLDGVGAAADVEIAIHAQLVGQRIGVVLAFGVGILPAPAELAHLDTQAVRCRQALLGQLSLHLVEQVLQLLLVLLPVLAVPSIPVGLLRQVVGHFPYGPHHLIALLAAAVRPGQVVEVIRGLDRFFGRLLTDLFQVLALWALQGAPHFQLARQVVRVVAEAAALHRHHLAVLHVELLGQALAVKHSIERRDVETSGFNHLPGPEWRATLAAVMVVQAAQASLHLHLLALRSADDLLGQAHQCGVQQERLGNQCKVGQLLQLTLVEIQQGRQVVVLAFYVEGEEWGV